MNLIGLESPNLLSKVRRGFGPKSVYQAHLVTGDNQKAKLTPKICFMWTDIHLVPFEGLKSPVFDNLVMVSIRNNWKLNRPTIHTHCANLLWLNDKFEQCNSNSIQYYYIFVFNCVVCGNDFTVSENLKKHKSAVRFTHRQLNTKFKNSILFNLIVKCVVLNLQFLKTWRITIWEAHECIECSGLHSPTVKYEVGRNVTLRLVSLLYFCT